MGRVLVNGNPAKAAKQLKVNDVITIIYANKTIKAKILIIPSGNVSIQESSTLYELISE